MRAGGPRPGRGPALRVRAVVTGEAVLARRHERPVLGSTGDEEQERDDGRGCPHHVVLRSGAAPRAASGRTLAAVTADGNTRAERSPRGAAYAALRLRPCARSGARSLRFAGARSHSRCWSAPSHAPCKASRSPATLPYPPSPRVRRRRKPIAEPMIEETPDPRAARPTDVRDARPAARGHVVLGTLGRLSLLAPVARHGVAIAVALAATLARFALVPALGTESPYLLLFPASLLVALLAGPAPGIVAGIAGTRRDRGVARAGDRGGSGERGRRRSPREPRPRRGGRRPRRRTAAPGRRRARGEPRPRGGERGDPRARGRDGTARRLVGRPRGGRGARRGPGPLVGGGLPDLRLRLRGGAAVVPHVPRPHPARRSREGRGRRGGRALRGEVLRARASDRAQGRDRPVRQRPGGRRGRRGRAAAPPRRRRTGRDGATGGGAVAPRQRGALPRHHRGDAANRLRARSGRGRRVRERAVDGLLRPHPRRDGARRVAGAPPPGRRRPRRAACRRARSRPGRRRRSSCATAAPTAASGGSSHGSRRCRARTAASPASSAPRWTSRSARRRRRRCVEADRRKNEFLGMLSHELRNPLAPIRNSALPSSSAPTRGASRRGGRSAVIERQVEHLTRLVDDLLDVTRIARGKIQLPAGRASISASSCGARSRTIAPLVRGPRHRARASSSPRDAGPRRRRPRPASRR